MPFQFSTLYTTPDASNTPGCHLHGDLVCNQCLPPFEDPSGEQEVLFPPDDSIYDDLTFEQLYPSIMPTAFVPPVFHGSYPETNAVLGHEYYNTSLESPDVGFFAPTQFIPPMVSVQPTGVNIPAGHSTLAQGYSGQFGSDASAIATSGTSMGILSSADLASSQTHSFPAPLAGSASSVPPQAKSQSSGDLKPCKWRNNRGGICGELVGWHCQDHLAHAHGIFRIPSSRSIECGACGEQQKRKYILRHFREVHLEFRRGT